MNDHVTVSPGEHFNADRFPRIRRADLGEVTP
jgi:hypothetical protein